MNVTFNVNATVNVHVTLPQLTAMQAQLNRLEEGQGKLMAKTDEADILLAQINEATNSAATSLATLATTDQQLAADVQKLIDSQSGNVPDSVITSLTDIRDRALANATSIQQHADFSKGLASSLETPIPPLPPTPQPPAPPTEQPA